LKSKEMETYGVGVESGMKNVGRECQSRRVLGPSCVVGKLDEEKSRRPDRDELQVATVRGSDASNVAIRIM
jgi:hypothetical protein